VKARIVTIGGKRGRVANPAGVCPVARKPVAQVSDRAKRYRANQESCKPDGPKRCLYCNKGGRLDVAHLDGNESNGRRSNLAWACRSCNTLIGADHKAAGIGKRTRQTNPKSAGNSTRGRRQHSTPQFEQYAWALGMICRKRDEERGMCTRSNDPEVLQAVEIIRATPPAVRREYSARAWSSGRRLGRRHAQFQDVPF
jgi:hypothetical protein